MAAVPLSLALPAATASLAYLNARYQVGQDLDLLYHTVVAGVKTARAFKRQRANLFYKLEEHALASKTANIPFIAIPPPIPKNATPQDIVGLRCEEYTYREVYDTVLKYAEWLRKKHGVKKGDIVALVCKNKPLFIYVWYAIWSLGATAAFINTGLRGQSLLHCIITSTATTLVVDDELSEALSDEVMQNLKDTSQGPIVTVSTVGKSVEDKVMSLPGFRAPDSERGPLERTDKALLIFTSGTTGLPKAAVLPYDKLYRTCHMLPKFLNFTSGQRFYTALPLYHSSASVLAVTPSLCNGSTVIISPHFSPSTFFASATAANATAMQYIGELCRYLTNMPPSPFDKAHKIRLAFGNGMRPEVWPIFKSRFDVETIAEFYAATESPASSFVKSKNDFHAACVGRVGPLLKSLNLSGTALVVHDVETGEPLRNTKTGFCERVAVGEAGELISALNPDNVEEKFQGYFGNEKATSSKVLRNVFKKGDAYFRTGDLLRTDHEGHYFFADRIGDTFRWKGENVSTGEVETTLSAHPAITEANVYGVQLPNHDGRAGCAAIVLSSEPSEKTFQHLAAFALQRLPRYAAPLFIRVVQKMETTGTNKYQKHGLRTQGVDPTKAGEDRLYWLNFVGKTYEPFGKKEWEGLIGGQTKL